MERDAARVKNVIRGSPAVASRPLTNWRRRRAISSCARGGGGNYSEETEEGRERKNADGQISIPKLRRVVVRDFSRGTTAAPVSASN